jgi:hypothetical protein
LLPIQRRAGLNAGLDQEGGGTAAIVHLADAISHNLTTSAAVETAFRRLMRMRIRLGMFDPPSLISYNKLAEKDLRTVGYPLFPLDDHSSHPYAVHNFIASQCLLSLLAACIDRAQPQSSR